MTDEEKAEFQSRLDFFSKAVMQQMKPLTDLAERYVCAMEKIALSLEGMEKSARRMSAT